ncbi:hypothetical protein A9Q99_20360 [Gammaproteobacteria bacterium 45_16_T64]|nr:hypothetical protein A9Q99_20360 [Gammaproteobacteria bacterium 45_16_T64]
MMANFSSSRHQRGTVIITVLMLVAVATFLAVEITYRQRIDIVRTSTLLALDQSEEYAKSAEAFALYALKEDLFKDIKNTDFRDIGDEEWSTPLTAPIGRGVVSGNLVDLQGRFNLNRFMLTGADDVSMTRRVFLQLLADLNIPSGKSNITASIITERITDWMDVGDTPGLDGLESQEYLLLDPPYQAGDRVLVDLSELLLVTGMSRKDLDTLSEFVSILPPTMPININTASIELLGAIPCLQSAQVQSTVQGGGFSVTDLNTFYGANSAYIDQNCTDAPKAGFFSVNSQFFLLNAEATIENRSVRMHSVLYRNDVTTKNNVKVLVVQRKLLDPFSN